MRPVFGAAEPLWYPDWSFETGTPLVCGKVAALSTRAHWWCCVCVCASMWVCECECEEGFGLKLVRKSLGRGKSVYVKCKNAPVVAGRVQQLIHRKSQVGQPVAVTGLLRAPGHALVLLPGRRNLIDEFNPILSGVSVCRQNLGV